MFNQSFIIFRIVLLLTGIHYFSFFKFI